MPNLIDAKEYAKKLYDYDDILILAHAHPDGDTIGTALGLLRALTNLGKNVCVACADEISPSLRFTFRYANLDKCYFGRLLDENFSPKHILTVDIASDSLIGSELSEYSKNIQLALDHHEINTLSCMELFVEKDSSSAGETMYFALCELEKISGKKIIDKVCASALFTAIASDSGNFKFSSTSGRTMRVAGELIDLGAENSEISRQLFDVKSLESFRAEAVCIRNIEFFMENLVAFSFVDYETFEKEKLCTADFDSCVQILRMLKGVEIAVFAKEKTDDDGEKYRISMRSNTDFDVAEICALFDGGGHKKAAGCTISGNITEVKEKIISAILEKKKK